VAQQVGEVCEIAGVKPGVQEAGGAVIRKGADQEKEKRSSGYGYRNLRRLRNPPETFRVGTDFPFESRLDHNMLRLQ
jgi:hypothetical protein